MVAKQNVLVPNGAWCLTCCSNKWSGALRIRWYSLVEQSDSAL